MSDNSLSDNTSSDGTVPRTVDVEFRATRFGPNPPQDE